MQVSKVESEWQVYRTRFLIRAKQLTEPLVFVDALGREHCGNIGDYLVESSDSTRRIAPREIFKDVYVAMGPAGESWRAPGRREIPVPTLKRRFSKIGGCDHGNTTQLPDCSFPGCGLWRESKEACRGKLPAQVGIPTLKWLRYNI